MVLTVTLGATGKLLLQGDAVIENNRKFRNVSS